MHVVQALVWDSASDLLKLNKDYCNSCRSQRPRCYNQMRPYKVLCQLRQQSSKQLRAVTNSRLQ